MTSSSRERDFHQPSGRPTYSPRLFSACRDAASRSWAAWHATEGPLEVIRVLSPEACPQSEVICRPGLNFEPALIATPDGTLWCVWVSRHEGKWQLVARVRDDQWGEPTILPTDQEFVFHVTGCADAAGHIWLTYTAWDEGATPVIHCRHFFDSQGWSAPLTFAALTGPQMRPRLAAGSDGKVWLAADVYHDGSWRVVTASLSANSTELTDLTVLPGTPAGDDLFPTLCVDANGTAWLAWLTCTDVTRDGVVGRQTDLNCARWDGSGWATPPGGDDLTVTHLDWGMLPVKTYWGYNGLRRRPQLAADSGGIWLLWERHRDEQSAAQRVANGQFCGKYHDGSGWSDSYLICDGNSCFTVDSNSRQPDEALIFAAKRPPAQRLVDIGFFERSRSQIAPLKEYPRELWAGWEPVDLPTDITGPRTPYRVTCGGEEFELIWGDLHNHSYYSPDAEGEPLELLMWARDRGGLDFCCLPTS